MTSFIYFLIYPGDLEENLWMEPIENYISARFANKGGKKFGRH